MKRAIYLFLASLVFSSLIQAAEPVEPPLVIVLEVENAVINFSPSGQILGRVLVARCPECQTETMTFDQDTLLEVGGEFQPVTKIGSHTKWSGLITVTDREPNKITKFTTY
jgi:hypothetical protein